jgi:anti-anti-sigma factor
MINFALDALERRASRLLIVEGNAPMVVISPGWIMDVERGPDWLIVSVRSEHDNEWDTPPLAESIWHLVEQNFTYRLVLDLSNVSMLHTSLVGQLVYLQKRLSIHDGCLRICGLSDRNHDILRTCRLDGLMPHYRDRNEAVLGQATNPLALPNKPR